MFGGKNRIAVDKGLMDRLKQASEAAGYATVNEYVIHVLERELSKTETGAGDDDVKKRLEGLGYIS